MRHLRVKRTMEHILLSSISCLALCACRNSAKQENTGTDVGTSQAKIYAMDDVDKELKDGMVVMGGTRDDARAFFKAHTEFQVCKDMESFLVAVVKNTKVDPRADANPCSRLDQLVLEVVGVDGARRSGCVPPQRDLEAQFIRSVTLLADRPSRHGAPAPSMPAAPLPRTTLPQ